MLRLTQKSLEPILLVSILGIGCGANPNDGFGQDGGDSESTPEPAKTKDAATDVSHEAATDAGEPDPPPSPQTPNPLAPVVGYSQINLTEQWGSCGSHSGAISIGELLQDKSQPAVEAIESALYYTYGGRVSGGPGPSTLQGVFAAYFTAKKLAYKAVLFHSSSSVEGYIQAGSPVVAHTAQWGGHYIAIYGLKKDSGGTMRVYFSDGCFHDGLSNALPTGYLKEWSWSSFLLHAKGDYIAFVPK